MGRKSTSDRRWSRPKVREQKNANDWKCMKVRTWKGKTTVHRSKMPGHQRLASAASDDSESGATRAPTIPGVQVLHEDSKIFQLRCSFFDSEDTLRQRQFARRTHEKRNIQKWTKNTKIEAQSDLDMVCHTSFVVCTRTRCFKISHEDTAMDPLSSLRTSDNQRPEHIRGSKSPAIRWKLKSQQVQQLSRVSKWCPKIWRSNVFSLHLVQETKMNKNVAFIMSKNWRLTDCQSSACGGW